MSEPSSPEAPAPPPPDYGALHGPPLRARVVGPGLVMVWNIDHKQGWMSSTGAPLIRTMALAREIMQRQGYVIAEWPDADGWYAITATCAPAPAPLPDPQPAPPQAERVEPKLVFTDPQDVKALPNAALCPDELPPGARVAVPMLAAALPCAEEGDMVDVNRRHIAWNAWQWFMENRMGLRPLLFADEAPVPLAPPPPAKPKLKRGPKPRIR